MNERAKAEGELIARMRTAEANLAAAIQARAEMASGGLVPYDRANARNAVDLFLAARPDLARRLAADRRRSQN